MQNTLQRFKRGKRGWVRIQNDVDQGKIIRNSRFEIRNEMDQGSK